MSRSSWSIIGILAVWLVLAALAVASTKGSVGASPKNYGQTASQVVAVPEVAAKDTGCPDRVDRRNSDLCAQWKAADAAFDAARAAEHQITIGWISLFLGGVTMFAAIAAAFFAKNAADAAQKSYNAFVDLERARVISDASAIYWNPPHIEAVGVNVANIGKSEAVLLSLHCDFMEGCSFPGRFNRHIRIDRPIASAADQTMRVDAITPKLFATHPYFGGYVEYASSFGRTHKSYFLARIDWIVRDETEHGFDHGEYQIDPMALYCSRDERQARFGWPADD